MHVVVAKKLYKKITKFARIIPDPKRLTNSPTDIRLGTLPSYFVCLFNFISNISQHVKYLFLSLSAGPYVL